MALARILPLAALALLAACASPARFSNVLDPRAPDDSMPAVLPRAPEPPPEVRLIAAIEARGCTLTAANTDAVLLAANLTRDQLIELTPRLADAGRLEVAGEGAIRVRTESCTMA